MMKSIYSPASQPTTRAKPTLNFSREVWIDVHYRGQVIGHKRIDFIIEGVMVEIKARAVIEDVAVVQTLSYLKASGYEVGLLLNFGTKSLEIKRLINTKGSG